MSDIHWFAGFADGEGSFIMNCQKKKTGDVWTPRFKISNTSYLALEPVKQLLAREGIAFYIEERRHNGVAADGIPYQPYWTVAIFGLKRMARFCEWIAPHLIIKRRQAELMMAYCQSRLATQYEKNDAGVPYRPRYTDEELLLIADIRALNRPHRLHARPA